MERRKAKLRHAVGKIHQKRPMKCLPENRLWRRLAAVMTKLTGYTKSAAGYNEGEYYTSRCHDSDTGVIRNITPLSKRADDNNTRF